MKHLSMVREALFHNFDSSLLLLFVVHAVRFATAFLVVGSRDPGIIPIKKRHLKWEYVVWNFNLSEFVWCFASLPLLFLLELGCIHNSVVSLFFSQGETLVL